MPPVELNDQASGLRRLLAERASFRAIGLFGPKPALNALAGASLAFALARRGERVWIFDEAKPPQNATTQLGLVPRAGLAELVRGEADWPTALATGPGGIQVLAAQDAAFCLRAMRDRRWIALGESAKTCAPDWLLLAAPDTPGHSLAHAAPLKILLLPAAKNHLAESYALLKAAHQAQPDGQWLVLRLNAADAEQPSALYANLAKTAQRFLELTPIDLGAVPRDPKLELAARSMRPILEVSPASPAAAAFRAVVERLSAQAEILPPGLKLDFDAFWQRLGLIGRLLATSAMELGHAKPGRAYA